MTDHWLGVFLERLRWLGLEGNTVIALVSDHGILLGEHGWTGKIASMLHPPFMHVPLHPREPGGPAPGRRPASASPRRTTWRPRCFARRREAPHGMDGLNLRAERRRELAYGGYANWHYARTDEIAYVGSNRGRGRRLYDLAGIPARSAISPTAIRSESMRSTAPS